MLQGKITKSEYADTLNGAVDDYFKKVRDLMGPEKFEEAFEFDPDKDTGAVIIPEQMPEVAQYQELREAMKVG